MLRPLRRTDLDEARALLSASCRFDAAHQVAEEKLFGPAASGPAWSLAAPGHGGLDGVAVVSGRWLRLVAVHPRARNAGLGTALVQAAEDRIARAGASRVHVCDQPGNYLAPGIDIRDRATIAWFERRGYQQRGENINLLVDVRRNPQVSAARARILASRLGEYAIRRAVPADAGPLLRMVEAEFSADWAFEVSRALDCQSVHIAVAKAGRKVGHNAGQASGAIVAFAAHDGNNRGLGWFGPAATLSGHRGRGIGQALLCACLADVAGAGLDTCEIAWIGPRQFYERAVGICGQRRFAVLRKELS